MRNMLSKVGYKKDMIEKQIPYVPISGLTGENLLKKSEKMSSWWSGADVRIGDKGDEMVHVDCLYDALDKMCRVPPRPTEAAMRTPISAIYKIKGNT